MKEENNIIPPIQFPQVFYGRYKVEGLTPSQIDAMLMNGWFRNGDHVYTTLARFIDIEWKSTVMLRLPLTGFKMKKRLKKLIRKNKETFEVIIKPFNPREEIEDLWIRFKSEVHKWKRIPVLSHHLLRGRDANAFNSWEVSIYDTTKLIAFSIFDKGENAIASLEAAYDPGYRKHSLGLFTMLVEIESCIDLGLEYYYPGFIPKETPMFEYKLRPGNVEFFRVQSKTWIPINEISSKDWLFDLVLKELTQIKSVIQTPQLKGSIKAIHKPYFPGKAILLSGYNFLLEFIYNNKASLHVAFDILKHKYIVFQSPKSLEKEMLLPYPLVVEFKTLNDTCNWLKGFIKNIES